MVPLKKCFLKDEKQELFPQKYGNSHQIELKIDIFNKKNALD
jgi:hypothetical protein